MAIPDAEISAVLFFAVCFAVERCVLQQKCLEKRIGNAVLGTRWHTRWYNFRSSYTNPERHNAQRHRRADRQTDDSMMSIADYHHHTVYITVRSAKYGINNYGFVRCVFFARDSIYAIARICYRPSVRLSVCHTGGSVKNG